MNQITIINHNDQRVLTTQQLAESYGTEPQVITNNFQRNIERFQEGVHYFKLEGSELREFKAKHQNDFSPSLNRLYLWTKRGAARHAKMLNTDEAWAIYEELEENYFNQRPNFQAPQTREQIIQAGYQALLSLVDEMKPKAEYFDALVERNLLTNFRDTAKELGIEERAFVKQLETKRFIYRDTKGRIKPYAQHVPELFQIKEYRNPKTEHVGNQTLITPKGRETFRLLLKQI